MASPQQVQAVARVLQNEFGITPSDRLCRELSVSLDKRGQQNAEYGKIEDIINRFKRQAPDEIDGEPEGEERLKGFVKKALAVGIPAATILGILATKGKLIRSGRGGSEIGLRGRVFPTSGRPAGTTIGRKDSLSPMVRREPIPFKPRTVR